jgi:hypothetical protein
MKQASLRWLLAVLGVLLEQAGPHSDGGSWASAGCSSSRESSGRHLEGRTIGFRTFVVAGLLDWLFGG